jgi:hypothetical protein
MGAEKISNFFCTHLQKSWRNLSYIGKEDFFFRYIFPVGETFRMSSICEKGASKQAKPLFVFHTIFKEKKYVFPCAKVDQRDHS